MTATRNGKGHRQQQRVLYRFQSARFLKSYAGDTLTLRAPSGIVSEARNGATRDGYSTGGLQPEFDRYQGDGLVSPSYSSSDTFLIFPFCCDFYVGLYRNAP